MLWNPKPLPKATLITVDRTANLQFQVFMFKSFFFFRHERLMVRLFFTTILNLTFAKEKTTAEGMSEDDC